MNKNLNTPQQELDKRRAEALVSKEFPMEGIPSEFFTLFARAIRFNSQMRMNCHDITWLNFMSVSENGFQRVPFMQEMDWALRVLRAATPEEMGQTLIENHRMYMQVIYPIQAKWKEIEEAFVAPIRREIEAKVKAQGSVPVGKKIFAEA